MVPIKGPPCPIFLAQPKARPKPLARKALHRIKEAAGLGKHERSVGAGKAATKPLIYPKNSWRSGMPPPPRGSSFTVAGPAYQRQWAQKAGKSWIGSPRNGLSSRPDAVLRSNSRHHPGGFQLERSRTAQEPRSMR